MVEGHVSEMIYICWAIDLSRYRLKKKEEERRVFYIKIKTVQYKTLMLAI